MKRPQPLKPLVVDVDLRLVQQGRREVPMSPMEFNLLVYLAQRRERVVSRAELLSKVWRHPEDIGVDTRTVDSHISRLRHKLGDGAVRTVRAHGYVLTTTLPVKLTGAQDTERR